MSTAANPKADQLHPSDAPQESTGAVTSDSLAAESIKSGGAFSENDNAAISSVKGSNSTLNTTDTSGATALPAAKDGTEREQEQAKGLGADEKGTTGPSLDTIGQAEFSGTHSQEGYVGGSSAAGTTSTITSTSTGSNLPSGATGDSFADGGAGLTSSSSGQTAGVKSGSAAAKSDSGFTSTTAGTSASSSGATTSSGPSGGSTSSSGVTRSSGPSDSTADDAPNYAATVSGAIRPEGEQKPKGENLTEGGIPETKTFTGDVGGQHDPGRLATQEFTKVGPGNAASAGESDATREDGPNISGGQYDVLSSERA